jgi:hypothetical protein
VAWGATLLFFQVTLLAGYAVVDATKSRAGVRWVGGVQLILLVTGAIALVAARPFATAPGASEVTLGLALRLLTVELGLPVLALTLTAPAVQANYASTRAEGDRSAYVLYAASNAGSLAGLVAYPWLIEPRVGIAAQWGLWRGGVLVLAVLCAALWWPRTGQGHVTARAVPAPRPPMRTLAEWALRAAIPAALLAGVSEYLTRDIAPVPLLWVLPLGLYLATWIVAFSPAAGGLVRAAAGIQDVVAVAALVIFLNQPYALIGPIVALVALVVVGLAQHGALAASAPSTVWLARFYVLLALGGAFGTLLVVAAGPTLLPLSIEAPVALALAVALGRPGGTIWTPAGRLRFLIFALVATAVPLAPGITRPAILASASIGAGVLAMRWRSRPRLVALALLGLVAIDVAVRLSDPERVGADHSVLGRFTVARGASGTRLISGSTLHGLEPVAIPGERPLAALYYTRNGPFGDVVRATEAAGPGRRIGVVGLGIGSLACTASPETDVTFFELNPGVVRLARDTALFKTLSVCAPDAAVHLGDARLTLGLVTERYHLLVLDAFSSDAIPTHLLTREAFALYRERTEPDGIIAYHASNRFLDLEPMLGALAKEAGWAAVVSLSAERPKAPDLGPPPDAMTVIALAADSAALGGLVASGYWRWVNQAGRPWTDDWTPLASALRLSRATIMGK